MLAPNIGHNKPPGPIDSAREATAELNIFLTEHPVIEDHAQAKAAGAFIERTRVALKAMEEDRKAIADPIYAQWANICEPYRIVREPLEKLFKEIKRRWKAYADAEEDQRKAEAERLRREAEAAEVAARGAETVEQDVIACADVGECNDVGGAIAEADDAFGDYRRADRAAAVAERNVPVRVGSIMGGRAISMRTHEVLVIDDPCSAINSMGLTDGVRQAIVRDAKKFRDAMGVLPDGIRSTQERSL